MTREKTEPTPPYDGRAIANFLLDLADVNDIPITQMKLLKLIYFAHGWYLAINNQPLVSQDFEAWKFGPVIGVVRESFKHFGREKINSRAERLDIFTGEYTIVEPVIRDADAEFITGVFRSYIAYDGWTLSEMTHEKNSPWDRIWNTVEPIGRINLRIDQYAIRQHFIQLSLREDLIH